VRELLHAIEHAVSFARNDMMLVPKQLPEHIRIHAVRASVGGKARQQAQRSKTTGDFEKFPRLQQFRDSTLADLERQYLCDLVSMAGGDIEKACRLSGLARARIYGLLKKYGLSLRS
jgi:two-component system NtrC family response regulator